MASYNSYLIDGEIYVSVSTILNVEGSNSLIPWALKKFGQADNPLIAYNDFMSEVSDLGTRIHAFIEHTFKGDTKAAEAMVAEDTAPAITAFMTWHAQSDIKMVRSECRVHSKKWRVAGTCDLVATVNGRLYIVDIKTGSVQPKAFTQMAAYRAFMEQEPKETRIPGIENAGLAVLNVHREGKEVEFITHEDFYNGKMDQKDEIGLFHALRYIWAKRNLKSKKFEVVIKNMEDLISPLEKSFKKAFDL